MRTLASGVALLLLAGLLCLNPRPGRRGMAAWLVAGAAIASVAYEGVRFALESTRWGVYMRGFGPVAAVTSLGQIPLSLVANLVLPGLVVYLLIRPGAERGFDPA